MVLVEVKWVQKPFTFYKSSLSEMGAFHRGLLKAQSRDTQFESYLAWLSDDKEKKTDSRERESVCVCVSLNLPNI